MPIFTTLGPGAHARKPKSLRRKLLASLACKKIFFFSSLKFFSDPKREGRKKIFAVIFLEPKNLHNFLTCSTFFHRYQNILRPLRMTERKNSAAYNIFWRLGRRERICERNLKPRLGV